MLRTTDNTEMEYLHIQVLGLVLRAFLAIKIHAFIKCTTDFTSLDNSSGDLAAVTQSSGAKQLLPSHVGIN